MIRAIHLLWIIPLSIFTGVILMALMLASGQRNYWYERDKK